MSLPGALPGRAIPIARREPVVAPPSAAAAARGRLSTRLRDLAAPLLVSLLAVCAIGGSAALRITETGDRAAQLTLTNIGAGFDRLAVAPLELVDHIREPSLVASATAHEEAVIVAELRSVRSDLRPATYRAVAPQLRTVLAADDRARALLRADPQLDHPGSLAKGRRLASAPVIDDIAASAALSVAAREEGSAATRAQIESIVGAAAVIFLLLMAFWVFHRRAIRARSAAEEMAEAFGHSERHLAQAQRLAGVGSWEWRAADKHLYWSEQQALLHGWTESRPPAGVVEGLALIEQRDRARLHDAVAELWNHGGPLSVEYAVSGPAGTRLIHCQGDRTYDADGVPVGMIGTCQDVTDRFRRVEAERSNRAKSEFLSRMSHELRTPLNAILGFAQLLEMGELDLRQRGNVGQVVKAGRHLLSLVDEVLEMSRVEAGETAVVLEPVAVADVVRDAVDMVEPLAASSGVQLEVDQAPCEIHALADRQRLTQVLLNLLTNAIKYNRRGGHAQIAVSRERGRVEISVTDDGRGIAIELQARLFTPFDRLGAEYTQVTGAGLGLAASKAFVDAMNGSIDVRSAAGRGSTFTVSLAAGQAPAVSGDARAAAA